MSTYNYMSFAQTLYCLVDIFIDTAQNTVKEENYFCVAGLSIRLNYNQP